MHFTEGKLMTTDYKTLKANEDRYCICELLIDALDYSKRLSPEGSAVYDMIIITPDVDAEYGSQERIIATLSRDEYSFEPIGYDELGRADRLDEIMSNANKELTDFYHWAIAQGDTYKDNFNYPWEVLFIERDLHEIMREAEQEIARIKSSLNS